MDLAAKINPGPGLGTPRSGDCRLQDGRWDTTDDSKSRGDSRISEEWSCGWQLDVSKRVQNRHAVRTIGRSCLTDSRDFWTSESGKPQNLLSVLIVFPGLCLLGWRSQATQLLLKLSGKWRRSSLFKTCSYHHYIKWIPTSYHHYIIIIANLLL